MNNFNRQNKKLVVALSVAILLLAGVFFFWPTDYYRISPGIAKDISLMIKIEEDKTYPVEGELMLTAVNMRPARLFDYVYIKLVKPDLIELRPKPENVNMSEYMELMLEMMKESQLKAKAVALQQAGYNPTITGEGVKVVKVLEEGDAYGKLKEDDVIIAVDDQAVHLITETVNKIQDRELGQEAKVRILRDEEEIEYNLKTLPLKESSDDPSIGVIITPHQRRIDLPVNIEINAGQIGGPSAGGMFTLEIYNQLTKDDLTNGLKIAGTGTINLDGSLGPIDGIKQKIMAAKEEGAKIFFSPIGNGEEAKKMRGRGIEIVIVKNIEDIIDYLEEYEA